MTPRPIRIAFVGAGAIARQRHLPGLVPITAAEQRHWTAEADFIAAIREGTPVTPDFEEGLRYMEVTEAIYRPARTGRTVALPLGDC